VSAFFFVLRFFFWGGHHRTESKAFFGYHPTAHPTRWYPRNIFCQVCEPDPKVDMIGQARPDSTRLGRRHNKRTERCGFRYSTPYQLLVQHLDYVHSLHTLGHNLFLGAQKHVTDLQSIDVVTSCHFFVSGETCHLTKTIKMENIALVTREARHDNALGHDLTDDRVRGPLFSCCGGHAGTKGSVPRRSVPRPPYRSLARLFHEPLEKIVHDEQFDPLIR